MNSADDVIASLVRTGCRVVLLDIEMPGKNGLDVLKEIKKHDGGIQVLMLTGLVTMDSALRAFRLGAETCFFKRISDFDGLIEALDAAFDRLDHWKVVLNELCGRKKDEIVGVSA